ncbi:MAG: prenyltransferase [Anaerolineales bacterium]|nr:prenyltransferase [Anaerolineales bacterium]
MSASRKSPPFHRLAWQVLRLSRPHFLVGGLLLHTLGWAMAWYARGNVRLPSLLWGQAAISSIQFMTHFSNDYFDYAADRANRTPTRWSGGSRVLVAGELPPQVALYAALICAGTALVATFVLALRLRTGALTLPLLLLALALAWSYSAPPARLHSRGLGEVTVALLVPGLTPLVGFYLQTGQLTWLPLLTAIPLCGLQFAMILTINFPDASGDAAVGKRTLVLRLGEARAARLLAGTLALVYMSLPLLTAVGMPRLTAVLLALLMPASAVQAWRFWRGAWRHPSAWNSLGFWAILILVGSITLACLAYLLPTIGVISPL